MGDQWNLLDDDLKNEDNVYLQSLDKHVTEFVYDAERRKRVLAAVLRSSWSPNSFVSQIIMGNLWNGEDVYLLPFRFWFEIQWKSLA